MQHPHSPDKSYSLFSSNLSLKVEVLSNPPLFQNLVRGSTRSPLPPSAERKWSTLWTCGQLYLNQCQENFFINNHLPGFGRTVEIVRKKSGKAVSYKIKFMHTDTFKFHVGQIIGEYKIKLFKENKTTKEK